MKQKWAKEGKIIFSTPGFEKFDAITHIDRTTYKIGASHICYGHDCYKFVDFLNRVSQIIFFFYTTHDFIFISKIFAYRYAKYVNRKTSYFSV